MANEGRRFQFDEDQWRKIGSLAQIPSGARQALEFIIETSRKMSTDIEVHGKPQTTRNHIEKILSKTSALLQELHSLSPDIVVTMIRGDETEVIEHSKMHMFSMVARSNPLDEVEKLEIIVKNIEYLEKWLTASANRARGRRGQTGASAEATVFLVREIDKLLGKYGLPRVRQSRKRGASLPFVEAIVRIAHPDIGNGSINEAVKEAVRARLNLEAEARVTLAK